MLDVETFLTTLYVNVADFCKSLPLPRKRPGPTPSLFVCEVLTLALLAQWGRFRSERDFYRWADHHLRTAFPRLPAYSQFNRLLRHHQAELVAYFRHSVEQARCAEDLYEVIDSFGVATRNLKRRGEGWLPLSANKGYCSRLGWFVGFQVLDTVTSEGVITGFGFGPASVKDQTLGEALLAARAAPDPSLGSVGVYSDLPYLADKGFVGHDWHLRCGAEYGACVLNSPRRCDPEVWPSWLHRLHASLREIVETVHDKLLNTFGLDQERPHRLGGFCARVTATYALHNVCIWLNKQAGRHPLEFADLMDW